MEMRQLKALRAVISTGTTVQAAKILGVTQPAVSGLISSLERKMGIELFERVRGRLLPTPEALYIAEEAEKTISSFERLMSVSLDLRTLQAGQLRIVCLPGLSLEFLPRVIAKFLRDKPQVTVKLLTRSSVNIREWGFGQSLDLGIAELPIHASTIDCEPLSLQCVCVLPENHPLAQKQLITPQDLDGVPFISLQRDHLSFFRISDAFTAAGVQLNVKAEVRLFSSACVLVAEGVGVSIVEPITASEYAQRGVAIRPFAHPIFFDIGLLFPTHQAHSLLTQSFVKLLRTELDAYL